MTNANPSGLLVVISGPSGVGKTTIKDEVVERLDAFFSVSATTRPQTAADEPGSDYNFFDVEAFEQMIADDQLLEYADVFGNYYGTPRGPVDDALAAGRIAVLEIDVQGAIKIREARPDSFLVFILPPDEESLLNRLRKRSRESEADIQKRFQKAKWEIELAQTSNAYDAFVTNDSLERAIQEVIDVIEARRGASA